MSLATRHEGFEEIFLVRFDVGPSHEASKKEQNRV